jgi:hypothetical protein
MDWIFEDLCHLFCGRAVEANGRHSLDSARRGSPHYFHEEANEREQNYRHQLG